MIEKERLISIYSTMNEIRKFEEKALSLFEQNKLRGSVHLYIGEEASAATVCSHLRDIDYITSTHRGHGHCIAKGADLGKAMAELMGRETGYCRGRGGSMHIADFTKGNLGANAIVGAGMPIAVGGALAAKMKGTDQIAVTFFGDGASNQGIFHESLNLAAVWKLPVIFICENNGYGISVPLRESTSVEDIYVRSEGYNMPGYCVDGNDVLAIDEVMKKAVKRAKDGEGPTFIEMKTYRWLGHWTGDPQPYRTKEEVAEWKAKCPIKRLRNYMIENGISTEEDLDKLEREAELAVEEGTKFALDSAEPDPVAVMEDIFCEI